MRYPMHYDISNSESIVDAILPALLSKTCCMDEQSVICVDRAATWTHHLQDFLFQLRENALECLFVITSAVARQSDTMIERTPIEASRCCSC